MNQPRELFCATLLDFHKQLGVWDFWRSPRAQEIALEALKQDYMRVEHGNKLNEDAISLEAALQEYNSRKVYMEAKHD